MTHLIKKQLPEMISQEAAFKKIMFSELQHLAFVY